MQRRVTVYDIANELDISASTVSRVLNNSSLISAEKRELILKTAAQLGYKKRTIRRQRGRSILNVALFLPHAERSYLHLFYDPAELIHGIQSGFDDVTVNTVTALNDASSTLFEHKKLGDIDGCIFGFTSPDDALLSRVEARGLPYVLVNRRDERRNCVSADDEGGFHQLVSQVCRRVPEPRVGYLGFAPVREVTDRRRRALEEACADHGVELDPNLLAEVDSLEDIDSTLVERLCEDRRNVLFCFNDVVAVYVYQEALAAGKVAGRDFSLTGFDNSPVRELTTRKIDTISLSVSKLGHEAAARLASTILDREEGVIDLRVPGDHVAGQTIVDTGPHS
jgi:LacI family transcriptional regulator